MAGIQGWRRWALAWALVGAATSLTANGLVAQASEPSSKVEELMEFYLNGGSRWRQDNEDFEPGSGQPVYWVRVMEWGPGRDVVLADAFAVYESDRCESISHVVYRWDLEHDRLAIASFGAGGRHAEGHVERLGPSTSRTTVEMTLPDGTQMRFRDTSEHSGHDEYTSRGERWADDAWVAGDMVRWRRDSREIPCG